MIALAADCLLFQLPSGETLPCSAGMLSIELTGDTAGFFDPDFVRDAADAVFHYFKHELDREIVAVAEFERALERVLRGFTPATSVGRARVPASPIPATSAASPATAAPRVLESDLSRLASESGSACELFFFPRLRDELRQQLLQTPRLLRFRGLRGCVKHLAGVRRWTPRCRTLEDQIVQYLRQCLSAEPAREELTLFVE
jgi:hypothetical protein